MNTTATMGRLWDGLCDGTQSGMIIRTDGWTAKPSEGDIARFFDGSERRVVAFDGEYLNLDRPVFVVDNSAIWIGDGL